MKSLFPSRGEQHTLSSVTPKSMTLMFNFVKARQVGMCVGKCELE